MGHQSVDIHIPNEHKSHELLIYQIQYSRHKHTCSIPYLYYMFGKNVDNWVNFKAYSFMDIELCFRFMNSSTSTFLNTLGKNLSI